METPVARRKNLRIALSVEKPQKSPMATSPDGAPAPPAIASTRRIAASLPAFWKLGLIDESVGTVRSHTALSSSTPSTASSSGTPIPSWRAAARTSAAVASLAAKRAHGLGSPRGDGSNWADLDLSGVPQHARIDADGDALAAEIPGVGWLLVEQTAPERNLSAFATPSRAIIYTTGEAARNPFIELEFVALGSDAEQMICFCFM